MMLILAAVLASPPVQAQGLFDALRSIFGRGFIEEERPEGPYQAFCVRLCDGRFFPLPAGERRDRDRDAYQERNPFHRSFYRERDERRSAATSGGASPESLCRAMCPATPVKVFSGNGIDHAVAADGAPYVKLQNAFVYREKMIPECTCNGAENAGLTNLDPETDPTLQPGDIVVTAEGVKVFRGGRGQTALVPVSEARGMPESMRRNLLSIRITPLPEQAIMRPGIAPRASAPSAAKPDDIMNQSFVP
jgi:hypothetical protein